jgi:hypothetical protein
LGGKNLATYLQKRFKFWINGDFDTQAHFVPNQLKRDTASDFERTFLWGRRFQTQTLLEVVGKVRNFFVVAFAFWATQLWDLPGRFKRQSIDIYRLHSYQNNGYHSISIQGGLWGDTGLNFFTWSACTNEVIFASSWTEMEAFFFNKLNDQPLALEKRYDFHQILIRANF